MRVLVLSLMLVTACATTQAVDEPPAAAPAVVAFDPVGVYDFTTVVEGQTVSGTITIRRGDQGLAGSVTTPITGEFPLARVTVQERRVDLSGSTGEGNVAMQMTVGEDDRITGTWSLDGGVATGTLTGQRRRS